MKFIQVLDTDNVPNHVNVDKILYIKEHDMGIEIVFADDVIFVPDDDEANKFMKELGINQ